MPSDDSMIKFPGSLIGSKVRVKIFSDNDLTEKYINWLNDPEVVRFSSQRFISHDITSGHRYLNSFKGTDNVFLAITRLCDDMLIGTMTVYMSKRHKVADMGIMIGEKTVWGQGFGYDSWSLVIDYVLNDSCVRKVTAGTLRRNKPMIKLMERSGMTLEATRLAQQLFEGSEEDVLYYSKFRLKDE